METNQQSVEISVSHVCKRKKVKDNDKVADLTVLADMTVDFCNRRI